MLPPTPCLLIDEDVLRANLAHMAGACRQRGCAIRPHVKTHKCPEIARMQLEYGAQGITVAKLREAEIMADAGFDDILMAYPLVGEDKIRRAIELSRRIRLIVAAESAEGARRIAAQAAQAGTQLELWLEIDTGMHRTGVAYEQAVEVAQAIGAMQGLLLRGIFTYRNLIYRGESCDDAQKCGEDEGRIMVELQRHMNEQGLDIRHVSVGSTATAIPCAGVEGVSEVRPGTYVFYDPMQRDKGACDDDMYAACVMATVIAVHGERIVIDAGNKAISADCPPHQPPFHFAGYGAVMGHEGLVLERMTEEHGVLRAPDDRHGIGLGERLRIVPNHICPTVNLFDQAYLVKRGAVVKQLDITARGALW